MYTISISTVHYHRHGGVSGSALACGACKSCYETWVRILKRASQFKKSQTVVSTTECYFTLSVVSLIAKCTRWQRKDNLKRHSDSCIAAWLEMDRKVFPTTTAS